VAEYGLTPNGPNIKRFDVILEGMHKGLSERWGVNTRQNPESFLNHILANIADAVAELWEFGEETYYSQYPSSAEGTSLDNAAQFGGSVREAAAKSYYPIHCTGKDGTVLASGTMISSATNPTTYLTLGEAKTLTRSAFNKAEIKIALAEAEALYTVAINGTVFSFASESADEADILAGLAAAIVSEGFTASVSGSVLLVEAVDKTSTNSMVLSENLTTNTVTSVLNFGTVETGDIFLPDGVITNIVKASAGLLSVTNMCSYIAGRDEETDSEFRQSYADKIFNRSSMMLESIRSAILNNVQGVKSVAAYENDTHEVDALGRPPHSIEMVVDGGDSSLIAQQIMNKKAAGIGTYGDTTVVVTGPYDDGISIRFSRPSVVYVWFHVGITLSSTEAIPANYTALLRNAILENMDQINAGADVVPQQYLASLYKACPGIDYIDIKLFETTDASTEPDEYTKRSVAITARQRAFTDEEMIEVAIDG